MPNNKSESSEQLIAAGYRKYSGHSVDVYYNKDICIHVGNCVRGNRAVFNLSQRPWVQPDQADESAVIRVVNLCPSGALKFVTNGAE